MTYTKQTWATGDTITAEKLNHMEDGIAGGTLVIGGFSLDLNNDLSGTSDKTWQEIDDALTAGVRCVVVCTGISEHKQLTIERTTVIEGEYGIFFGLCTAATTSADGYPSTESPIG